MRVPRPLFLLCTLAASLAHADIIPCALFSDHMVLQAGMPVPVWGRSDAGEKVTVSIQGQTQSAVGDANGKWMLRLASLKPGGPVQMTISGKNRIVVNDVLVGEVWLGAGQSNMVFTVSKRVVRFGGVLNEDREIAEADYPKIRMFTVKQARKPEPEYDLSGEWLVCSPKTAPGFSAVGYLFARNLHLALNVPVGFITAAFGGSTAESWTRREALIADPQLKPLVDRFDEASARYREHASAGGQESLLVHLRDAVQDQRQPTVLYNGMLSPVIPYPIRGAIWYQGETVLGGRDGALLYGQIMETLVKDWRARWGEGDFPFFAVQLAPFANISNNPVIREQQARILSLPSTGLAITIDIGDPKDMHPHNKAPLGERLTALAMAKVYGAKVEYSGPVFKSIKVEGDAIRVAFTHTSGALVSRDGPLRWFQIAGEDRNFVEAKARIAGDTVVVSSPDVKNPVAVRYAWENDPEGCNLYNAYNFPAAPFRTDSWE
jgi:sialate O-acetylesterase